MIPVPAPFPKRAVEDHRRLYLIITGFLVYFTPVIDQRVFQRHALWQEKRESRAFFHNGKQFQFLADLSVVAFLCLFQHRHVLFQHRGFRESGAVYAAQHLVFRIAAPVGARAVCQLECLNGFNIHQVRPGAEFREFALLVKTDVFAFACVFFNELYFVWLILFFHQLDSVLRRKFKSFKRQTFLYDLFHLRLYFFKIFGRERRFCVKIVIEPVVNGGADRQFHIGIKPFYRLRHNVGCRVVKRFFPVFIIKGQYFQSAVLADHGAQVFHFAVYLAGTSVSVKAHGNVFGNIRRAHSAVILLNRAVFKRDFHSFSSIFNRFSGISALKWFV